MDEEQNVNGEPSTPANVSLEGEPALSAEEITGIHSSLPETVSPPETSGSPDLNPEPSTNNMEVHKHPNHVTHKKKWGEYLLEFFMIFFAVFLGFIAENMREHQSERKKEKEYIQSMIEDLRKDSAYLQLCINNLIPEHVKYFDSTVKLLQSENPQAKSREIYGAFLTATHWNLNYVPSQRTLSQLRNAGFYFIRNSVVGDRLSELEITYSVYNSKAPFIHDLQNDIDQSAYAFANKDVVTSIHAKGFADTSQVFINVKDLPVTSTINTTNKDEIKSYCNKLNKYSYYINTVLKTDYVGLIKLITETIGTLKKEYEL